MPWCLTVYPGGTTEETGQIYKNGNPYPCLNKGLGWVGIFSTLVTQVYKIPKQA